MDHDPVDVSDVTIDLTDAERARTDSVGRHRRAVNLESHQDLLDAFDADERVMEALLSALPPTRDEVGGRHHRAV